MIFSYKSYFVKFSSTADFLIFAKNENKHCLSILLIKSAIFNIFQICQEILNVWANTLPTRYFNQKSNDFWANAALLRRGKKNFFASTLLSIKSAIFKIFQIRQKILIVWVKPLLTTCFAFKSDDFWQNAAFLEDFRFLAQKRPPVKKFKSKASLYLMNFDHLSYESNLLILGHPPICERGGGAEPLHCIPSIGVYIHCTYIVSYYKRGSIYWLLS